MLRVVQNGKIPPHLKVDKKNLRILAQTTQQLAIFSKKVLITRILTGKHATTQYDMRIREEFLLISNDL